MPKSESKKPTKTTVVKKIVTAKKAPAAKTKVLAKATTAKKTVAAKKAPAAKKKVLAQNILVCLAFFLKIP